MIIYRIYKKIYNFFFKKNADLKSFRKQFEQFVALDKNHRLSTKEEDWYPCLNDKTETTGFDAHYIYHPAWAARIVRDLQPKKHIDISSTLTFCSILSAFTKTEFYDYRPAALKLDNLLTAKADLTNLHFETNSIESVSCMHTVEHIGLGRYGDPLDPEGDLKAIAELKRVVKPGGTLLFVIPVGKPKVMFNAHRIYDAKNTVKLFDGFTLKNFALIQDDGSFENEASIHQSSDQTYGCGCFWFVKNVNLQSTNL